MSLLKLTMILSKATTKVLFLVLALLVVSHSNVACIDEERQILLSFLSTLSNSPQSWEWNTTVESECCKWEGITCNPSSSIIEISLPSQGLTGEISPALSNLTNLSYLNLSHNILSGSLPVELFSISTSLKLLDVSFNKLSGTLPGFENHVIRVVDISSNFLTGLLPIINATSLLSLNATNNSLMGPIPNYLCTSSPFLTTIAISYNKFIGEIPPGIGNCIALRDFHAGSNDLVGSLPDELFKLVSLQNLCLFSNRIYGSLDGALIEQLRNLVTLDLSRNFLTGHIPETIGHLKKLRSLNLGINNLIGELPSAIENCSDLRQLNLQKNSLTGNLQFINFTKLFRLQQLDLYNNSFMGDIPESIYACKNLNALRLSLNKLGGQISPAIENLGELSFLSLSATKLVNLTGALKNLGKCKNLTALLISHTFIVEAIPIEPTWENGFENIQILSMGSSNLTRRIPPWISNMTKLEVLELAYNHFTGQIPDWIGNLSSLFYIDLSYNYLSGNIPQSITHLSSLNSVHKIKIENLTYLGLPIYGLSFNRIPQLYKQPTALPPTIDLGNNLLNGTIPQEIGQLTKLVKLNLGHNNLSGTIPQSIGNLTNLEFLDLSRNKLTGSIPVSITLLHFLSTFNIASNNLSGPVPTGGQFNTFWNSSYEGNSYLCGPVVMRYCGDPSNGDDQTFLTPESFDESTVIAVVLGFLFGVSIVVLEQFYRNLDSMRAWLLHDRHLN